MNKLSSAGQQLYGMEAKGGGANGRERYSIPNVTAHPFSWMRHLCSQRAKLQMVKHVQIPGGLLVLQVADKFPEAIDTG